jgi:hypothetical protein
VFIKSLSAVFFDLDQICSDEEVVLLAVAQKEKTATSVRNSTGWSQKHADSRYQGQSEGE